MLTDSTHTATCFLTLPLELRVAIYTSLMGRVHDDEGLQFEIRRIAVAFASTCRLIRAEFLPIFIGGVEYLMPGIESIVKKIGDQKAMPRLLSSIRKVSIHLWPLDFLAIASVRENELTRARGQTGEKKVGEDFYLSRVTRESKEPIGRIMESGQRSRWTISQNLGPGVCVANLWDAFKAIKGLISLDLTCVPCNGNFELEHDLLLRMAGTFFSDLQVLRFRTQEIPLDFLSLFPKLKTLSFSGYSKSTPAETVRLLSGLREFESLVIDRNYDCRGYLLGEQVLGPRNDSITPELLAGINPLKRLAIELDDGGLSPDLVHSGLRSPAAMVALCKHKDSLTTFNFTCHEMLDKPTLEGLLNFISVAKKLVKFKVDICIPRNYGGLDLPSFFPKHLECGEMIVSKNWRNLDKLRLGFMGGKEFEFPSVATPRPNEMMLKYWSSLQDSSSNLPKTTE